MNDSKYISFVIASSPKRSEVRNTWETWIGKYPAWINPFRKIRATACQWFLLISWCIHGTRSSSPNIKLIMHPVKTRRMHHKQLHILHLFPHSHVHWSSFLTSRNLFMMSSFSNKVVSSFFRLALWREIAILSCKSGNNTPGIGFVSETWS